MQEGKKRSKSKKYVGEVNKYLMHKIVVILFKIKKMSLKNDNNNL